MQAPSTGYTMLAELSRLEAALTSRTPGEQPASIAPVQAKLTNPPGGSPPAPS